MKVQKNGLQVEASQTSSTATSATYTMKVSRRGTYFWGLKDKIYVCDHNGRIICWAAPEKSKWKWDGTNYYLTNSSGSKQTLSWEFWKPQSGYVAASSLTYTRTVTINRGNARQGSKTINIGIESAYSGSNLSTCKGNLTLTTSKIADASNVVLTANADGVGVSDRYIRLSASFTNPENYYTGYLYHGSTLLGTTTNSISKEIKITNSMFETTQSFSFVIKGKDGVSYVTKPAECYVEPGGVGIWNRKDGVAKEVTNVYYKNNNGEIIEVTEAWVKRNNQAIKTVK